MARGWVLVGLADPPPTVHRSFSEAFTCNYNGWLQQGSFSRSLLRIHLTTILLLSWKPITHYRIGKLSLFLGHARPKLAISSQLYLSRTNNVSEAHHKGSKLPPYLTHITDGAQEYGDLQKKPLDGIKISLTDESDIHQWQINMDGPKGSPYEVLRSQCFLSEYAPFRRLFADPFPGRRVYPISHPS